MVNIKYIARRLTFTKEIRGIFPKIQFFIEELISLSTRIGPNGLRQINWIGPHGDVILNYYDSIVCWRSEILDDHLYDIKFKTKNPIILDIGANQGFFSLWIKYNNPSALIHAFEPVKKSFEILKKNINDNKYYGINTYNIGVLDKTKTLTIRNIKGGAGLGDSICIDNNLDKYDKEEIKVMNIDSLFKYTPKFDLVKIDIEGSEYPVIKNCNFWKKSDMLIIEFHDMFKKSFGYEDIDFLNIIEKAGFVKIDQIGEYPTYVCRYIKK